MSVTTEAPASQRQQLVEVSGFPRYFANKSGGEIEAETTKAYDGGNLRPTTMGGPAETANVVVSRPYRPKSDGPKVRDLARLVGRWRTTIKVWDTDPDLGPIGQPVVYANALLVRLARPEADAASADTGTFELEFAVDGEA